MFYLSECIEKRKLREWRMDLAIAQNPHLKPEDQEKLWNQLSGTRDLRPAEFDDKAFERLKQAMSGSQGIQVK